MGKSSIRKGILYGAMALGAYFGNSSSADAQVATQKGNQKIENRIMSRERDFSATGDGILLKDFIYNHSLTDTPRLDLNSTFKLYTTSGSKVSYDVIDGYDALAISLNKLELKKNQTDKERESINYLKGLLKSTKSQDVNSVRTLRRAVEDGVIDVQADGLMSSGRWQVKDGLYAIIVQSDDSQRYVGNMIPILYHVKTGSDKPVAPTRLVERPQVPDTAAQRLAREAQQRAENLSKDYQAKFDSIKSKNDLIVNELIKTGNAKADSIKQAEEEKYQAIIKDIEKRMNDSSSSLTRFADSTLAVLAGYNDRLRQRLDSAKNAYMVDSLKSDSVSKQRSKDSTQAVYDSTVAADRARLQAAILEGRRQQIADSTKAAKDTADARAARTAKSNLPRKAKHSQERELVLGVETGYGSNKQGVVGAFLEAPVANRLSGQFYANFNVLRGQPLSTPVRVDTTEYETRLIGPGTYKDVTESIRSKKEEKAVGEIGVGLVGKLNLGDYVFDFPLRAGMGFSRITEQLTGRKEIRHTRNGELLEDPTSVENTMAGKTKYGINSALSVGANWNINKKYSVGVSAHRVGKDNSIRLNARRKF